MARSQRLRWERLIRSSASSIVKQSLTVGIPKLELGNETKEIERTKIPEIHLLTVDEDIAKSKAQEMANHNIIVVAYDWVANSESLAPMKNIISFEDYLFEEIPSILKFWGEK